MARKMEGGGILHRPAGAGGSGSWNSWLGSRLHVSCFFFFSFSFHHPFPQPILAAPKPSYPPPRCCSSAWPGAPGFPKAVTRAGEGEGHVRERLRSSLQPGPGGPEESKNGLLFLFLSIAAVEGVGGERGGRVRLHTPSLFLPRPNPPGPSLPTQLAAAGRAGGETPSPDSAAVCGAVGG